MVLKLISDFSEEKFVSGEKRENLYSMKKKMQTI